MIRVAAIKPRLTIDVDPFKPVSEICEVITGIVAFCPGQEEAILKGVQEAIKAKLDVIKRKGDEANAKQLLQSNASD